MGNDKNKVIISNYDELARVSPLDILSAGRPITSLFGYAGRLGRFLARELELKSTDRVLDAGCNVGVYHASMAKNCANLIGVDASPHAIERARIHNRNCANANYQIGNLLGLKPEDFPHRFDKILCYSVVHILGDMSEFEALMKRLISLLDGGHGIIFLGEMREKEMYDAFLNRTATPLRDLKFAFIKKVWKWAFRSAKVKDGIPPTLFTRAEIAELITRLGGRFERIPEEAWHPYYNTCVDYRIRF